ncbi:MAG: hypothetical protein NTZ44_02215 [Candidatus Nomurabacteria bacterium]|nr:hypothetical protein [Candidatus Nomurabacteria bacterium]
MKKYSKIGLGLVSLGIIVLVVFVLKVGFNIPPEDNSATAVLSGNSLLPACTVTVLSPNGGQSYSVGQNVTITWTSTCPTTDQMQIRLYNQAGMGINISPVVSGPILNNGSKLIIIPNPTFSGITTYGLHYKIRIIDNYSGGVSDYSDNMFSIMNTLYLFGGMGYNDVYSSTNATNWSLVSAQDTNPNLTTKWTTRGNDLDSNTPYFNNKMWVVQDYAVLVGGNWNSKIWSSPDGINWTVATTIAFPHQESSGTNHLFVFNNKLWLIREINGGNSGVLYTNPIYSSSNGTTWTHIDTDPNTAGIQDGPWGYAGTSHMMSVSVFQNKIFVDGTFGATAGIWSSPDGITWTNNTNTQNHDCVTRNKHTSIVFNSKLWLLGGNTSPNPPQNDICSSLDGITWTTALAHAPWTVVSPPNNQSMRGDFTSFVFNNRIYVGYGYLATQFNSNIPGNTLWSSLDGTTWIQETMTGNIISNRQDLSVTNVSQ